MASRNPSNRIEVDLKLLQDNNVEKLREFGKQFDKSIDTLASLLGSVTDRVDAGREATTGGRLSPTASVAGPSGPTARMGGVSTGGFGDGGRFANGGGGGTYGGGG